MELRPRRNSGQSGASGSPVTGSPAPSRSSPAPTRSPVKREIVKTKFVPRTSRLDTTGDSSIGNSDFWGFYSLMCLSFVYFVFTHMSINFSSRGILLDFTLLQILTEGLLRLVLVVIAVCVMSFGAVVLAKVIAMDVLPGWVIFLFHHGLQATMIGTAVLLAIQLDLGVSQSLCLLMQTFVLFMKMHSFVQTNRDLMDIHRAKLRGEYVSDEDSAAAEHPVHHGRKRSKSDPLVAPSGVKFPENITLSNFFYFLCAPTLVYEMEYPRTERVRIGYIIEKVLAFIASIGFMYTVTSHYIIPILRRSNELSFVEAVSLLVVPMMSIHLMLFYVIFECVCNVAAELTRFADREFYSDWWNSTTFDEYARKWNKPVHEFLLRHVYLESMVTYKASKTQATFATFFFSSLVHELLLAVALRVVRPYLLAMQMFQLPLIFINRLFKGTVFGNVVFWFGLMTGPPILAVAYCREYYANVH